MSERTETAGTARAAARVAPDAPASILRSRRRFVGGLVLATTAAYGVLAFPYGRALWWLYRYPDPPDTLALPVRGVSAHDLSPSFGAPRWAGPHEGIDIVAPAGTPVMTVADGVIIGNRPTAIGGNVLWIMGAGRRLYYYAHLRELGADVRMGRFVAAGKAIGTVGNTGNAATTTSHLHFAVYTVHSKFLPLRYSAIDPYPLLTSAPPKDSTTR